MENKKTITVKQTNERTFNIFLPHFRKDKNSTNYYKVEADVTTHVSTWENELGIRKSIYLEWCAFMDDTLEISDEEFYGAKDIVLSKIINNK